MKIKIRSFLFIVGAIFLSFSIVPPAISNHLRDNYVERWFDGRPFGFVNNREQRNLPARCSIVKFCGDGLFLLKTYDLYNPFEEVFFLAKRTNSVESLGCVKSEVTLRCFDKYSKQLMDGFSNEFNPLSSCPICVLGVKHWSTHSGLSGAPLNYVPGQCFESNSSRSVGRTRYVHINEDLKTIVSDTGKFDHNYWLAHRWSRFEMFVRFLRDYDVIGMTRDKLICLLGEGHLGVGGLRQMSMHTEAGTLAYGLYCLGCVPNSYLKVKFHFQDGKVDRWNFFNCETEGNEDNDSPPITTNVVIAPSSPELNSEWPRINPK